MDWRKRLILAALAGIAELARNAGYTERGAREVWNAGRNVERIYDLLPLHAQLWVNNLGTQLWDNLRDLLSYLAQLFTTW